MVEVGQRENQGYTDESRGLKRTNGSSYVTPIFFKKGVYIRRVCSLKPLPCIDSYFLVAFYRGVVPQECLTSPKSNPIFYARVR